MKGTLVFCLLAWHSALFALPENGQLIEGKAALHRDGDLLTIQASDRTILHWDSFSIGSQEVASFQLPSSTAAILNRVTGGSLTEINGQLLSNGQVYLINPHGVVVGQEGFIQVGAFFASTLDCANEDFLSGKALFLQGEESSSIDIQGNIIAKTGDLTLLGNGVKNGGTLEALQGKVTLGAGQEIIYLPSGDERIQIHLQLPIDKDAESKGIHQLGDIHALSAEIKADGNLYAYAIQTDGWIEAAETAHLVAEKGFIAHTGLIEAPEVHILGEHVRLLENARIDASTPNGGGTVLIGGDYQGKNPAIMNAMSTFADANVVISANALERGDGGKIILWADDATGFKGTAQVRGGPQGGDGGLVEVSGKQMLDFSGYVDAGAPFGKVGKLLLDPSNVTISTGADANMPFGACGPPKAYVPNTNTTGTVNTTVLVANLDTTGGGCDVTITTNGVAGGSAGTLIVASPVVWTSNHSLSLTSTTTMAINAALTSSGGGAINLSAGTTLNIVAAINWSGTSSATSTLSATNGALTINAAVTNGTTAGNLILSGTTTVASNASGIVSATGGGTLNISAGTTMVLAGAVNWSGTTSGTSTIQSNSTMTLNANVTNSTTAGNLNVNGGVTTSSLLTIGAGTTMSHSSTGTLTLTSATAGSDITIAGILSATNGNLSISLSDDFTLNAAPAALSFTSTGTFTYATTTVTNPVSLFNGPVTIGGIANWGSVLGTITFASGSSLTTTGTGTTNMVSTGAFNFAAGSTISHGSSGALTFQSTGGAMTLSTPLTVAASTSPGTAISGASLVVNSAVANNSDQPMSFAATTTTMTFAAGAAVTTNPSAGNLSFSALTTMTMPNNITQSGTAGNLSFSSGAAMNLTGNVANNSLTGTTLVDGGTTAGLVTIGAAGTTFTHTTSSNDITLRAVNAGNTSDLTLSGALQVTGVNLIVEVSDIFTVTATTGSINFAGPGKTFSIDTTDAGTSIAINGAVVADGILDWTAAGGAIQINDGLSVSGTGTLTVNGAQGVTTGAASVVTYDSSGDLLFLTPSGANNVAINGSFSVTNANATFFPSNAFTQGAASTINFSAPGKLLLIETGLLAGSVVTLSGITNVTAGNMTVTDFNDITISATTGSVIYNVPGGTLLFNAVGGADPDFVLSGSLSVLDGMLTVTTFDDITFNTGSTFTYSSTSPLTLTANNPGPGTTPSITWNGTVNISNSTVSMSALNDITFGGTGTTTYTSPLPWTMTASTGNITFNGPVSLVTAANWTITATAGSMAVNNLVQNTSTGSFLTTCGNDCTIGFNTSAVPSRFGSAGGATNLSVGNNLFIISSETTAGATSTLGFSSGGQIGAINVSVGGSGLIESNRNENASVESSGMLTMTFGSGLALTGDPLAGATGQPFIRSAGVTTISASNFFLTGFSGGSAFIEGTNGAVSVLANVNISLISNAYITNSGTEKLVVVVDQQAPLPPQIGNGQLNMFNNTSLSTNGGDLSIFTATPSQNTLIGTLNGATSLSQGTQVFGVWYSQGGNDPPPFTIFYKTGGTTTIPSLALSNIAIAEMLQEYFDRSMGWSWLGEFSLCHVDPMSSEERTLYYRKPFEYPLYDDPPITPCSKK